jgi:hypothetical protein
VTTPPDSDPKLDELYAQLREEIEEERGPRAWLRSRSTLSRAIALAGVSVGMVAVVVLTMAQGDVWTGRGALFALSVTGLLALLAIAIGAVLRPSQLRAWSPRTRTLVAGSVVLGSLAAIVLVGDGGFGDVGTGMCLIVGGMVGAPVFVLATLLDRDPRRGSVFGGLAGALTGALATQILCGAPSLTHLLVEHFGIVAVYGALFSGMGWLLARTSAR